MNNICTCRAIVLLQDVMPFVYSMDIHPETQPTQFTKADSLTMKQNITAQWNTTAQQNTVGSLTILQPKE
jgi:hypothetical protein